MSTMGSLQFSIRDLVSATAVIAIACGLLSGAPFELWIASLPVVFLFVALDLLIIPRVKPENPLRISVARFIALHSTGYSAAALACLIVVCVSRPVGGLPVSIAEAARQIAIVVYLLIAAAFGAVSFFASLVAVRRYSPAKWLALINLPATLFFGSVVLQKLLMGSHTEQP